MEETNDEASSPLSGIRVIDLSQYLPGPFATRLLCDLGAQVIKVEPPSGDPLRHMFTQSSHSDSGVYRTLNRGKTVVRLNLKDTESLESLLATVSEADVLLESFRPGVVDRLGLGYESVSRLNPGIVYCSLSGYGQDGPFRLAGGHDINYCAAAGVFSHTTPIAPPFPLMADHCGAIYAVNSILAALFSRTRNGKGMYLDVSLYESVLSFQYPAMIGSSDGYQDIMMLTGGAACYNFYRTSDNRTITLGALEPTFWGNFCEAMKKPEWQERQYEPMPQNDLISEVGGVFAGLTLDEVNDMLNGVDCCFEPVSDPAEIGKHSQTVSRGMCTRERLAFPARFNNSQPLTRNQIDDHLVGVLPRWNNCNHTDQ